MDDISRKQAINDIAEISSTDYSLHMEDYVSHSVRSLRQAASVLRARRRARGITQKQLAEATGTAQSTISDIETGAVSVSLDVYLRLLEALGGELTVTDRTSERDST